MEQEIDMQKLGRIHYLKHYQGGNSLILDPADTRTAVVEQVDLEEGSVLVREIDGDKDTLTWVNADYVQPAIKTFADLQGDDLKTLLNNIVVEGARLRADKCKFVKRDEKMIWFDYADNGFTFDLFVHYSWAILTSRKQGHRVAVTPVDNTAQVIFLMCELGYDVANFFNDD